MASITKTATVVVSSGSWTDFTTTVLATQDGSYATTNATSYTAGVLRAFSFQVPSNSIIDGIAVAYYFSSSAGNATAYLRARLSKDAGSNWSSYATAVSTNGTLSGSFGGATDLWGLSLTESEVNNDTNFYVGIEGYITASNRQNRLDYIAVTVYYTEILTQNNSDTATASDAIVKETGKVLSDSVTVTDELTIIVPKEKTLDDSVTVTDEIETLFSYGLSTNPSDSVTVSDQLSISMTRRKHPKVYVGGQWVRRRAKVYVNGEWIACVTKIDG